MSSKQNAAGQPTIPNYYVGMHFVLGHGPWDTIRRILVDEKKAWKGSTGTNNTTINIDKPELFGGQDREGGVSGPIDILMGRDDQQPNSYLVEKLGGVQPAYRKVVSMVLKQCYVGNNYYLKKWSMVGERIHVVSRGEPQWYDAKAEVPALPDINTTINIEGTGSTPGTDPVNKSMVAIYLAPLEVSGYYLVMVTMPEPHGLQASYQVTVTGAEGAYAAIFNGNHYVVPYGLTDTVFCYLTNPYLAVGAASGTVTISYIIPGTPGTTGVAAATSNIGKVIYAAPLTNSGFNLVMVTMDRPHDLDVGDLVRVTGCTGAYAAIFNGDHYVVPYALDSNVFCYWTNEYLAVGAAEGIMVVNLVDPTGQTGSGLINAVHVLHEMHVDNIWGYGYPIDELDDVSWRAAADRCYDEGLGFAWYWKDTTLDTFKANVMKHINARVYRDRLSGKIKISLIRKIDDLTGLLEMNQTNSGKVIELHKTSVNSLTSSVVVEFVDYKTNKKAATPPIYDMSLVYRQRSPIEATITYDGCATQEVAQKLAAMELYRLSTIVYSGTVECDRTFEFLNPGDPFLFNRSDVIEAGLVLRVVNIDLGSTEKSGLTIDFVQDSFSVPHTVYGLQEGGSVWVNPNNAPLAADIQGATEAPYYIVATLVGDSTAQSVPDDQGYIVAAAASPTPDAIAAALWTNSGGGYVQRSTLDFCFTAMNNDPLDKITTSVVLKGVQDLELLTINHFIQLGNELMGVTAINTVTANFIDTTTLTVIRGVLDTVPVEHGVGERIYGWHNFYGTDRIAYLIGETIGVKITPGTALGILPIGAAQEDLVGITGRMHAPYAPGNLQINGAYWPASLPQGYLNLTWSTRNRLQQTSGLINWYSGNITSEAGVTYWARVTKVSDGSLVGEVSSAGSTASLITFEKVRHKLTVWASRGSFDSYQKIEHIFDVV